MVPDLTRSGSFWSNSSSASECETGPGARLAGRRRTRTYRGHAPIAHATVVADPHQEYGRASRFGHARSDRRNGRRSLRHRVTRRIVVSDIVDGSVMDEC